MITYRQLIEKSNPRIPRKPGQPAGSDKHSDLYTDENPRGTIRGLKFATTKDAKSSVSKIKNSGRKHAHKIQAAIAMEQRAKVAGKSSEEQVTSAERLTDKVYDVVEKMGHKKSEASYMDLHIDAIREPKKAGSLK